MTRAAQVVFAALVLAAFGAFFAAQELKTSPSVVQRFMLKYPVTSPNGDGRLDRQRVTFRLKRADTVDVAIVDDRGDEVAEIASGLRLAAYRQIVPSLPWDGRTDGGRLALDGVYRVRITLRDEGRSVVVPRSFRVDRTPPAPAIVSIGPDPGHGPELLPRRDGRPARIRLNAPSRNGRLLVYRMWPGAPKLTVVKPIADGARLVTWAGRDARGAVVAAAPYLAVVEVRDKAGNIGTSVPLDRRGLPAVVYGRELPGRGGITVRRLAAQVSLLPLRGGRRAPVGIDARRASYTWTLRRTGAAPSRRGSARRAIVRIKLPDGASGVYLFTARRGPFAATVPLTLDDRASHRVLVVLPAMTWQGRNPVDDDGDGRPNLLGGGLPVRLARVFGTPEVPGFGQREAPTLAWLDRARHRYDLTTDVALAAGVGPKLAGHAGVLFAGDAVWLPARLQARLRAFVTRGGTLATVGVQSFQRQATLTPRSRLIDPTPPATADAFGAKVGPLRAGRFDLTNATDEIDLFKGTSGRFLGYDAAEITDGERPKIVASAVDARARVVIVAQRVGRGTVIRFGLPQLPSRLRTDPDVQALLDRTWQLLSR